MKHFIAGNKLFKYLVISVLTEAAEKSVRAETSELATTERHNNRRGIPKNTFSFLLMISVWLLCVNSSRFVSVIMISVLSPRHLISRSFQHVLTFLQVVIQCTRSAAAPSRFLQEKLVIPSPSHCNSEGIACDRLCLSKGRLVHQYAGEIFYYVGSWQQIDFVCIGNRQGGKKKKKMAFFS